MELSAGEIVGLVDPLRIKQTGQPLPRRETFEVRRRLRSSDRRARAIMAIVPMTARTLLREEFGPSSKWICAQQTDRSGWRNALRRTREHSNPVSVPLGI